ncbi:hypothetical protein jaqu_29790 [Jannaschia aquimarina]|uniref:Uncharacterized protein n=1 Tax=Jannaschia aquimarina TaxID=935700 RepID=A0A0D1EEG3_9RHOB|nr:hypothetical protein jaqu_29790 [Jannaschia aquimarina]
MPANSPAVSAARRFRTRFLSRSVTSLSKRVTRRSERCRTVSGTMSHAAASDWRQACVAWVHQSTMSTSSSIRSQTSLSMFGSEIPGKSIRSQNLRISAWNGSRMQRVVSTGAVSSASSVIGSSCPWTSQRTGVPSPWTIQTGDRRVAVTRSGRGRAPSSRLDRVDLPAENSPMMATRGLRVVASAGAGAGVPSSSNGVMSLMRALLRRRLRRCPALRRASRRASRALPGR